MSKDRDVTGVGVDARRDATGRASTFGHPGIGRGAGQGEIVPVAHSRLIAGIQSTAAAVRAAGSL
jgi:hypothetical protein